MNREKAVRPGGIVTKMLVILDVFGINRIAEIINDIYDCYDIAIKLCRYIFIVLPKKPGVNEYKESGIGQSA